MFRIQLIFLIAMGAWSGNFIAAERLSSVDALRDINFLHEAICQNHPGIHNAHDPEFAKMCHTAYQQALIECPKVHNDQQHIDLLKKYTHAFNDAHLRFSPAQAQCNHHMKPMDERAFAVRHLTDKVTWITLPTFHPNERQKLELISIIDPLPHLRSQSRIIFDVRGNTGGNSVWGDKVVEGLFGSEYATLHKEKMECEVFTDWRVSNDNVAHVKWLTEFIGHEFGTTSESYIWICGIYRGMSDALAQGELYFREEQIRSAIDTSVNPQNQCLAKIFVVIDRHCGSACLDFIDYLKALKHPVTLVGQTTNADSLYMEVRNIEAPSKLGSLVLPIKVYRNRPRGHNQPYHPDIPYPDNINDTKNLQSWVMKYTEF